MEKKLYLIQEWVGDSYWFSGVYDDVNLFIKEYVKDMEAREGENNKFVRSKIDKDYLYITMNYGTMKFLLRQIETNTLY